MPVTLTLGRDPGCDVVLAEESVSRVHAELVVFEDGRLFVRDSGSQNGTRIVRAGQRRRLQAEFVGVGDSVVFGDLELVFESLNDMVAPLAAADRARAVTPEPALRPVAPARPVTPEPALPPAAPAPPAGPQPDGHLPHGVAAPGLVSGTTGTQPGIKDFLPVISAFQRLRQRGLLVPIVGFAVFVALLFGNKDDPSNFFNTMGVGICLGTLVVIYRACGKRKPWPMFAGVMTAEAILLTTLSAPYFFVFRTMTGAEAWIASDSFVKAVVGHFVAAGLMEELMKMTPVIALIFATRRASAEGARRWGVQEPLDAIVYACAAATAFVMIETLAQYVPETVATVFTKVVKETNDQQFGAAKALLQATQVALVRTLNGPAGHLAYSGYFGYYVGLGLLRPRHRARLWLGGYVGAAAMHGVSNASIGLGSTAVLVAVKLMTVSFLVGAILNARKLSPTRSENFATRGRPAS